MMNAISMTTLLCVAPDVVDRAQRFETAVRLLRQHVPEREVRRMVREHYRVSYWTASRTVEMAKDVA